MTDVQTTQVAVIGAGPIGLETAAELKRRGIPYVQFDRGSLAATIAWFPEGMTFFSSPDRIGIAGIPIQTPGQRKCTKEEYLAYLRSVALALGLEVRTQEEVTALAPLEGGGFRLRTRRADGETEWRVENVVLATGGTHAPRRLGIPGEDLPHVSHLFEGPHRYFGERLLVVGGRNSAVEAALRCWHAGAHVTLSYRRAEFDPKSVKYWLLPELLGRIEKGEITAHLETTPRAIEPGRAALERADGTIVEVPADFVLLLTGYVADMRLFREAGVELVGEAEIPRHDPRTMMTSVPGLFVAGTAVAGTQSQYQVFLENCHVHTTRIAAALSGEPPPPDPAPNRRRES